MTTTTPTVAPPTAGQLADRETPTPATYLAPAFIGSPEADQVFVARTQLSALLRQAHPSGATMRNSHNWWDLRLPAAGLTAGGEGFDELAVNAVAALRAKVADVDPGGESGDPLVWLVLTSTDAELRSWLHIPS